MQDLFATERGRKFWFENGEPIDAEFDLDANSRSTHILSAIIEKKAGEHVEKKRDKKKESANAKPKVEGSTLSTNDLAIAEAAHAAYALRRARAPARPAKKK